MKYAVVREQQAMGTYQRHEKELLNTWLLGTIHKWSGQ